MMGRDKKGGGIDGSGIPDGWCLEEKKRRREEGFRRTANSFDGVPAAQRNSDGQLPQPSASPVGIVFPHSVQTGWFRARGH
jgi:hypothetical protein